MKHVGPLAPTLTACVLSGCADPETVPGAAVEVCLGFEGTLQQLFRHPRLAHDMVSEQREPPTFYDSAWYTVCESNLEQYANMWRDQDFAAGLPACEWLE